MRISKQFVVTSVLGLAVLATPIALPTLGGTTVEAASEFTKEKAIHFAEEVLDNDDLVFSSDGVLHHDSEGQVFYSLRAQSKDLMEDGGSGTVGFYDVYQNGDVVESKPR